MQVFDDLAWRLDRLIPVQEGHCALDPQLHVPAAKQPSLGSLLAEDLDVRVAGVSANGLHDPVHPDGWSFQPLKEAVTVVQQKPGDPLPAVARLRSLGELAQLSGRQRLPCPTAVHHRRQRGGMGRCASTT